MESSLDLFTFEPDTEQFSMIAQVMDSCKGLSYPNDCSLVFDSTQHAQILVTTKENPKPGNLRSKIPNIQVRTGYPSKQKIILTWEEARQLCAALWQVTNLAEFG